MLQVLIAETCNAIAAGQSDGRTQGHIPWQRAANDGPDQHGAQAEQRAAQQTASGEARETLHGRRCDIRAAAADGLPVGDAFLDVQRL